MINGTSSIRSSRNDRFAAMLRSLPDNSVYRQSIYAKPQFTVP
jgi:hypothetical protein